MTAFASEATTDGSGAAGISGEVTLADVDGSQFAGEEWYDQRDVFRVNREDAHTSFTSFKTVEDAKVHNKENSPFYQLLSGNSSLQRILQDAKEIFVFFQGVESAFYVWVNGELVGYSEDSYTAAEFDISKYLNAPGEQNNISVQVYRWSDGSYLEDQEFIRLSGIFRDVFLFCKEKDASIFDFNYTTDLDDNYENAVINTEVTLRRYNEEEGKKFAVEATLFDANQNEVFSQSMGDVAFNGNQAELQLSVDVENPKKWSAEDPNLYQLVYTLKDEEGNIVETAGCNVGFREVEIINNGTTESQIIVNGQPIMFKGVDRHETLGESGRHITEESMIQDIKLMKHIKYQE